MNAHTPPTYLHVNEAPQTGDALLSIAVTRYDHNPVQNSWDMGYNGTLEALAHASDDHAPQPLTLLLPPTWITCLPLVLPNSLSEADRQAAIQHQLDAHHLPIDEREGICDTDGVIGIYDQEAVTQLTDRLTERGYLVTHLAPTIMALPSTTHGWHIMVDQTTSWMRMQAQETASFATADTHHWIHHWHQAHPPASIDVYATAAMMNTARALYDSLAWHNHPQDKAIPVTVHPISEAWLVERASEGSTFPIFERRSQSNTSQQSYRLPFWIIVTSMVLGTINFWLAR